MGYLEVTSATSGMTDQIMHEKRILQKIFSAYIQVRFRFRIQRFRLQGRKVPLASVPGSAGLCRRGGHDSVT